MRTLINLFLIFVLCFAAIGINPAYAPISLESDTFQEVSDISNISIVSDTDLSTNPNTLDFYFNFPKSITYFVSSSDYLFTMEISKNGEIISSKPIVEFITDNKPYEYKFSKDLHYSISLDYKDLELSSGSYEIKIKSNFSDDIKPLLVNINIETAFNYIPSRALDASEISMLRAYLPDETRNYMVPVSIIAPEKLDTLSGIMKFMKQPITGFPNLIDMNLIGDFNYGVIKKDILYVDLKSNDPIYTLPTKGTDIMKALTQSISYYYDEPIQFLVDYNKRNTFFNETNISEPVIISHKNVAYKLLHLKNRDYLVEINTNISSDASIDEQIAAMINNLKSSSDKNILSILTDDFIYNGTVFINGTLTFNVTKDYPLKDVEMDSIGFSLLSLVGVEQVDLRQDSKTIHIYNKTQLINPIK